jgi:endonuclease-3
MKRAEKAAQIARTLGELYPDPRVPLDHCDAYTLLVAVLLSAQTTDARVNIVTPALFAAAPTPAALARLDEAEILGHIKTCGLAPTKARHLKRLAERLVSEFDGAVPRDLATLETLPGVGHKTASVVVAQAFGEPAFPVDTHIHRLAARWGLSDGTNVERTERDLKALFPRETWNVVHLRIILFGREHCPALRHDPAGCPICSWAAVGTARRSETTARPRARARRARGNTTRT